MPEGVYPTTFPPRAYIIGAQKAARTTLATMLNQHPEITLSNPKEPDFFTNNWDKGLDWYCGCFSRGDTLLLDASTSYTMDDVINPDLPASDAGAIDVPQLIRARRPDAKFTYTVRDPAARMFSAYWHNVRERQETRSIRRAVAGDPAYLDPGVYFVQISRYLKYFDLDRFLFIRFEDFVRDPLPQARRCAEFLGAAPFPFEPERVRIESFRYTLLGRVSRNAAGMDLLKQLLEGLRTILLDRVYRFLKAAGARPLPRLIEEDLAWLTGLFRKDIEAFEELIKQRPLEAEPAVASNADHQLPAAVVSGSPTRWRRCGWMTLRPNAGVRGGDERGKAPPANECRPDCE